MMRRSNERSGGGRDNKKSRRRDGDSRETSRYGDAAGGVRKRSHLVEGIKDIDANDVEFLRKFITEHGKIVPSRLTGATAKQQRKIKSAIRRARTMGLLA